MKKLILAIMILLICGAGFGQTTQNYANWANQTGNWDFWLVQLDSDTLWFEEADTLYSDIFSTWPIMGAHIEITDTTVATDSIKLQIDLMQANTTDSSKFVLVKALYWQSATNTSSQQTLAAAGVYGSNLTITAIYPFLYSRYRLIALTDNKKLPGNWIKIVTNGWAPR